MAAIEVLETSSALLEPQSLTEISDDEVNPPASDDEDSALTAARKELSSMGAEGDAEDKDQATKPDPQMNGVMVLSLLDKIIGAVDQIQQTQSGLEARQQDMERSVTSIQGELTKLAKSHSTTSNSVNKMMEKVQKVSVNVKTVRATLEKQGGQIRKLETNEAELLKRRNFKVMIYQVRPFSPNSCEGWACHTEDLNQCGTPEFKSSRLNSTVQIVPLAIMQQWLCDDSGR
ncbi:unnamed protein product [Menidia menidia]|uniref:(Atlantic silverside) hypothetical protein n=1 Tax=Menidia menidia TaxID=238744 RepID=A0A8S4B1Z7_9TELE|nr:unnamed protein product [Menidia menidia]